MSASPSRFRTIGPASGLFSGRVRDIRRRLWYSVLMGRYFLNKYDWTEVVVSRGSEEYFDGLDTHRTLTRCHEADALDYGEPNPFVAASADDIALAYRYSLLINDYVAGAAEVNESAEAYVTCLRYRLRGKRLRAEVLASDEDREAHRLREAMVDLYGFVAKRTAFDRPELTWALQRANKVLWAVERAPSGRKRRRYYGPVRYYVSNARHLLMAVCVGDTWLEGGAVVEGVYSAGYHRVSPLGAEWLWQLGQEFRGGWTEASRFYRALQVVATCGDRLSVRFSEHAAQEKYEKLAAACVADREELCDYLAFISDLRKASVLNAMTLRIAERLHGKPLRLG